MKCLQIKKSAVAIEKQKQKQNNKQNKNITKWNKTNRADSTPVIWYKHFSYIMELGTIFFVLTGYLLAIITNIIIHLELNVQWRSLGECTAQIVPFILYIVYGACTKCWYQSKIPVLYWHGKMARRKKNRTRARERKENRFEIVKAIHPSY